jgi:hypothetical protein
VDGRHHITYSCSKVLYDFSISKTYSIVLVVFEIHSFCVSQQEISLSLSAIDDVHLILPPSLVSLSMFSSVSVHIFSSSPFVPF